MRLLASRLCIDRGRRRILSDVSFVLERGALLVTGENGTGKSSLLRALAGLLPLAGGTVAIEDCDAEAPLHYLGDRDALKSHLTVRENLAFATEFLREDEPGDEPSSALAQFDVAHTIDVPVAWLSTGTRRRVALARLLVARRPLWLLDEPTSGLDARSVRSLEIVMDTHVATGGLIVAATHLPLRVPSRELRLGEVEP